MTRVSDNSRSKVAIEIKKMPQLYLNCFELVFIISHFVVLPMLLGIANFDAVEGWEVAVHNEQRCGFTQH